jgi:murein lipoprotein
MSNFNTAVKTTVAAFAIALATGCASTSDLEKVRATAEEAKAAAAQAQATADAAKSSADAAAAAANQANTCCTDTNEKIDRMFKKSMYK